MIAVVFTTNGGCQGRVLVVDWSIVAAFVKLLRAALPNPIQFSIVRAKLRFLGCGVKCVAGAVFSVGVRPCEGPCTTDHEKASTAYKPIGTLGVYSYNKSKRGFEINKKI